MVSAVRLLIVALIALSLLSPLEAQSIERTNRAELLMRSASFGTDIGPGICYTLMETSPGHWVAYAQRGELSPVTWAVVASPMSGPNAGYVTFVNGENEKLTLDVLEIDTCYGVTGEIRIGW